MTFNVAIQFNPQTQLGTFPTDTGTGLNTAQPAPSVAFAQPANKTDININFNQPQTAQAGAIANQSQTAQAETAAPQAESTGKKHKHGKCGGDKDDDDAGANAGGDSGSSKIDSAIAAVTGHASGTTSQSGQAAKQILAALNADPSFQAAQQQTVQSNLKTDKAADSRHVTENTIFHQYFNKRFLGKNLADNDILSPIESPAEKALNNFVQNYAQQNGMTAETVAQALMSAGTQNAVGVDLSDNVTGETTAKNVATDNADEDADVQSILKDKPSRSKETELKSGETMDPLGFALTVGWNHLYAGEAKGQELPGQFNRPTQDSTIFNGADPNAAMKIVQNMLSEANGGQQVSMGTAYKLIYPDLAASGISGKKINAEQTLETRMAKIGKMLGVNTSKIAKSITQLRKVTTDLVQKNPAFKNGIAAGAGALTGAAAGGMCGCPYAGITVGVGTAAMAANAMR